MLSSNHPLRKRSLTAIDAAMVLIIILLMVQMWLLVSTLESYLAGSRGVLIPAAVLSGVLFAACAALLAFVHRLDRKL